MRNSFVHDPSEIAGWDISTLEGREVAQQFTLELTATALAISALFTMVFNVWAKDNFDRVLEVETDKQRQMLRLIEKHFGAKAREVLDGKYHKARLR
jgi:hypothetical protein